MGTATHRLEVDPITGHRTYRHTAGEIVDQRGDLGDRLGDSTVFRELIATHLETTLVALGLTSTSPADTAKNLVRLMHAHVRHAEAYRISADMMTLLDGAAAQLNDLDRLDLGKFPTACGFARLDRPLVISDIHGRVMLGHAISWGPVRIANPRASAGEDDTVTAVMMALWNDIEVEPDDYAREIAEWNVPRELRTGAGQWSLIGVDIFTNDMRAGPPTLGIADLPDRVREKALRSGTDLEPIGDGRTVTNTLRWVIALLEMLNQRIVESVTERPNAYARRRAKQRKQSRSDVTIIQLRRPVRVRDETDAEHARRVVDWHSRWVVRGHWRRQRVGKGRQEIRRTWVSAHVKGPDDKPLVVRDKLYDVR